MNAPRVRLDSPAKWLACFFGAGLAPTAPGTFGTLAAVPLYLLLAQLPWMAYAAATLAVIAVGVVACGRAARELGTHDHPALVIDEVAGYLVTMAVVDTGIVEVVAGFALFRLFDITKPWPIGWLDRRVGGGLGIMLDDVVAGVLAATCLWAGSAAGLSIL